MMASLDFVSTNCQELYGNLDHVHVQGYKEEEPPPSHFNLGFLTSLVPGIYLSPYAGGGPFSHGWACISQPPQNPIGPFSNRYKLATALLSMAP